PPDAGRPRIEQQLHQCVRGSCRESCNASTHRPYPSASGDLDDSSLDVTDQTRRTKSQASSTEGLIMLELGSRYAPGVSRLLVLTAVAISVAIMPAVAPAQPDDAGAERFLVWELGSRLSLAALGYGRGADQDAVNRMIDQVRPAAAHFGMEIPPLPP